MHAIECLVLGYIVCRWIASEVTVCTKRSDLDCSEVESK